MIAPSPSKVTHGLAIERLDDFVYGSAPHPVRCGRGVEIGGGVVIPEINFTLPPLDINRDTWQEVRRQYREMVVAVCRRAVDLQVPGLLLEFETLPPMTVYPDWGAEITRLLAETLAEFGEKDGLAAALRLTVNDTREHVRPPRMRSGPYLDAMLQLFAMAGDAGADLVAIESTGGKEIHDDGLLNADLKSMLFAIGILAPRDVEFLWSEIIGICRSTGVIPSGDSGCGFANTAMALAEQKMLPKVVAALARVASVPRALIPFELGARGPSKDCAYEGPYIKAITGAPISMEGRSASCAHLSAIGNVSQAVCDCWSNESVQNVRLLSASAPVVSMEQLAYDCRLANTAASRSREDARRLRDWLAASDSALDPQAFVLRPDVVLRISKRIIEESSPYLRTRRAIQAGLEEIWRGFLDAELQLSAVEAKWLERLRRQADRLPKDEAEFTAEMMAALASAPYLPAEYGLTK